MIDVLATGNAARSRDDVPDLTVVIPTLGRPLLRRALARLVTGTHWPGEVIVVHQGTDPAVRRWLDVIASHGLRTQYIQSAERSKPVGVNRGIRAVRTPFVAIIDDDCFVAADWVRRVATELRLDPGRIITGRVCAAGTEPLLSVNTGRNRWVQIRPRLSFDVLSGGNVAMSLSVLPRTGLFDETLTAAEDCEFAYRALRAGVRIEFVPEMVVEHWGWRTQEQRTDQYRWYGLNHGAFYGKYLRQRDVFIAARLARHVARSLLALGRSALRRDRERLLAERVHTASLLKGVVRGWSLRGEVPRIDGEAIRQ